MLTELAPTRAARARMQHINLISAEGKLLARPAPLSSQTPESQTSAKRLQVVKDPAAHKE
jgi:hypothetical protein